MRKNYKLERLQNGETFSTSEKGNSMVPLIKSGQEHIITPATWESVEIGDIVYCKVKSNYYTHLVTAKNEQKGCQISNNKGYINGWTKAVFGVVKEVVGGNYKRSAKNNKVRHETLPNVKHETLLMGGVEIDLKLVDLVQTLWNQGVKTFQCCQGGDVMKSHNFINTLSGKYSTTYETDNIIKEKAHLIFDLDGIDIVKELLPTDVEFIIGDKNCESKFFEFWLGSFNAVWVSWIL